jgi:hypothetical protein
MTDNNVLKTEEIEKLFKGLTGSEKLERESAISYDGRNLIIRIPKEIADVLRINDKNRFEKNFKFIIDENEGKKIQSFEITERTKPIRETKNANTNKKTKKNNRPRH